MTEETINVLCEKFNTTIDQLIPVYTNYVIHKNIISSIISLVITFICIFIIFKIWNRYKKNNICDDSFGDWVLDDTISIVVLFFDISILFTAIIFIIFNTYDIIMWNAYPQMRFFETFIGCVK